PEIAGELGLRAKEAAMRHQPVQQHERRPRALVPIGDSGSVRCREKVQLSLPAVASSREAPAAGQWPDLKPESIFNFCAGELARQALLLGHTCWIGARPGPGAALFRSG